MTYEESKDILDAMIGFGTDFSWQEEAIRVAIKALEKQIPKKPKINLWDKWLECPICGEVLSDDEGLPLGDGIDINYCWGCGQALDWSD